LLNNYNFARCANIDIYYKGLKNEKSFPSKKHQKA